MSEVLNDTLLKNVAQFGSKVLHLSSNVYDPYNLFMQDFEGAQKRLKWDKIHSYFKTQFESIN